MSNNHFVLGIPSPNEAAQVLLSGAAATTAQHLARWQLSINNMLQLHPRVADTLMISGIFAALLKVLRNPAFYKCTNTAQQQAWHTLVTCLAQRGVARDAIATALHPFSRRIMPREVFQGGNPSQQLAAVAPLRILASTLATPQTVPSQLDLAGPGCGLCTADMPAWPAAGLTVALWLRLNSSSVQRSGSMSMQQGGGASEEDAPPLRPGHPGQTRQGETLLFRFLGQDSKGLEAVLTAAGHVAVRSYTGWTAEQITSISVPARTWAHLVVVCEYKTLVHDSVRVYLNGQQVLQGPLRYPSPSSMKPPLAESFVGGWAGQLASACAFSGSLSEEEVYQLGAALPSPASVPRPPAHSPTPLHPLHTGSRGVARAPIITPSQQRQLAVGGSRSPSPASSPSPLGSTDDPPPQLSAGGGLTEGPCFGWLDRTRADASGQLTAMPNYPPQTPSGSLHRSMFARLVFAYHASAAVGDALGSLAALDGRSALWGSSGNAAHSADEISPAASPASTPLPQPVPSAAPPEAPALGEGPLRRSRGSSSVSERLNSVGSRRRSMDAAAGEESVVSVRASESGDKSPTSAEANGLDNGPSSRSLPLRVRERSATVSTRGGLGPLGASLPRAAAPLALLDLSARGCHAYVVGSAVSADGEQSQLYTSSQPAVEVHARQSTPAGAAASPLLQLLTSALDGLNLPGADVDALRRTALLLRPDGRRALQAVGGAAVFLPLLAAAAASHRASARLLLPTLVLPGVPVSAASTTAALQCVAGAVASSVTEAYAFLQLGGLPALGQLVRLLPASHLTIAAFDAIVSVAATYSGATAPSLPALPKERSACIEAVQAHIRSACAAAHGAAAAASPSSEGKAALSPPYTMFGPAVAASAVAELMFDAATWMEADERTVEHVAATHCVFACLNMPLLCASLPAGNVWNLAQQAFAQGHGFAGQALSCIVHLQVLYHTGQLLPAMAAQKAEHSRASFALCPPLFAPDAEEEHTEAYIAIQLRLAASGIGCSLPVAALASTVGPVLRALAAPPTAGIGEAAKVHAAMQLMALLPVPLSVAALCDCPAVFRVPTAAPHHGGASRIRACHADTQLPEWSRCVWHGTSVDITAPRSVADKSCSDIFDAVPAVQSCDVRVLEQLQRSGHCAAAWCALRSEHPELQMAALRLLTRYAFWQSHGSDLGASHAVVLHFTEGHAAMLLSSFGERQVTLGVYRGAMALLLGLDMVHVMSPRFAEYSFAPGAAGGDVPPPDTLPATLACQPIRHPAFISSALQLLQRAPLWVQLVGLRDWSALLCGDSHDAADTAPLVSLSPVCNENRGRVMQHAQWPVLLLQLAYSVREAAAQADLAAAAASQAHVQVLAVFDADKNPLPVWAKTVLETVQQTTQVLRERMLSADMPHDVKVLAASSAVSLRDLPFEQDAERSGADLQDAPTAQLLAALRWQAQWEVAKQLLGVLRSGRITLLLHSAVQDAILTTWPELWATIASHLASQLVASLCLADSLRADADDDPARAFAQVATVSHLCTADSGSPAETRTPARSTGGGFVSALSGALAVVAPPHSNPRGPLPSSPHAQHMWRDVLLFSSQHMLKVMPLLAEHNLTADHPAWRGLNRLLTLSLLHIAAAKGSGESACDAAAAKAEEAGGGCTPIMQQLSAGLPTPAEQWRRLVQACEAAAAMQVRGVQSVVDCGLFESTSLAASTWARQWLARLVLPPEHDDKSVLDENSQVADIVEASSDSDDSETMGVTGGSAAARAVNTASLSVAEGAASEAGSTPPLQRRVPMVVSTPGSMTHRRVPSRNTSLRYGGGGSSSRGTPAASSRPGARTESMPERRVRAKNPLLVAAAARSPVLELPLVVQTAQWVELSLQAAVQGDTMGSRVQRSVVTLTMLLRLFPPGDFGVVRERRAKLGSQESEDALGAMSADPVSHSDLLAATQQNADAKDDWLPLGLWCVLGAALRCVLLLSQGPHATQTIGGVRTLLSACDRFIPCPRDLMRSVTAVAADATVPLDASEVRQYVASAAHALMLPAAAAASLANTLMRSAAALSTAVAGLTPSVLAVAERLASVDEDGIAQTIITNDLLPFMAVPSAHQTAIQSTTQGSARQANTQRAMRVLASVLMRVGEMPIWRPLSRAPEPSTAQGSHGAMVMLVKPHLPLYAPVHEPFTSQLHRLLTTHSNFGWLAQAPLRGPAPAAAGSAVESPPSRSERPSHRSALTCGTEADLGDFAGLLDLRATAVSTLGREEALYSCRCYWVTPLVRVEGALELTAAGIYFTPEHLIQNDGSVVGTNAPESAFQHEALVQVKWQPNEDAEACAVCKAEFVGGLVSSGKHHCRRCGMVVCQGCSQQRLPLPSRGHPLPVRVCDACVTGEMNDRVTRAAKASPLPDSATPRRAAAADPPIAPPAGAARGAAEAPAEAQPADLSPQGAVIASLQSPQRSSGALHTPASVSEGVDALRGMLMRPHFWPVGQLQSVYPRRFLLRRTALEVVFSSAAAASAAPIAGGAGVAAGIDTGAGADDAPGIWSGHTSEPYGSFVPGPVALESAQHGGASHSSISAYSQLHTAFEAPGVATGQELAPLFLVFRTEIEATSVFQQLHQLRTARNALSTVSSHVVATGHVTNSLFPSAASASQSALAAVGAQLVGPDALIGPGAALSFLPAGQVQVHPSHAFSHGGGFPHPCRQLVAPAAYKAAVGIPCAILPLQEAVAPVGDSSASPSTWAFDQAGGGVPGAGGHPPHPSASIRGDTGRSSSSTGAALVVPAVTAYKAAQPEALVSLLAATRAWQSRLLSNLDYLLTLNRIAGRSSIDWSQYPIVPWVIADYTSDSIDVQSGVLPDGAADLPGAVPGTIWRDLRKPIGALNPVRLQRLKAEAAELYADIPPIPSLEETRKKKAGLLSLSGLRALLTSASASDGQSPAVHDAMGPPPFAGLHRGHYSHSVVPVFYFVRREPFTTASLALQGGRFDHADRLFHSIPAVWNSVLQDDMDIKELTPEWYTDASFLCNSRELQLGSRQTGEVVGDVQLPPWASSAEDFVVKQRAALESEHVSSMLNHWVDLVFGCKQRGQAAADADNLFKHYSYEGGVDMSLECVDAFTRLGLEMTILNFGQTPPTLFTAPHLPRLSGEQASHAAASLGIGSALIMVRTKPSRVKITSTKHTVPIVALLCEEATGALLSVDCAGNVQGHAFAAAADGVTGEAAQFKQGLMTHSRDAALAPQLAQLYGLYTKLCAVAGQRWEGASVVTRQAKAASTGGGLFGALARAVSTTEEEVAETTQALVLGGPAQRSATPYGHDAHVNVLPGQIDPPLTPFASRTLLLHGGSVLVRGSAFDGALEVCTLATRGSGSGTSLQGCSLVHRIHWHAARVSCLAASEDGSLVVSGDAQGGVAVWRTSAVVGGHDDGHAAFASASAVFGSEGVAAALAASGPPGDTVASRPQPAAAAAGAVQDQAGSQGAAGVAWSASTAALAADCSLLNLASAARAALVSDSGMAAVLMAGTCQSSHVHGSSAVLRNPSALVCGWDGQTHDLNSLGVLQGVLAGMVPWHAACAMLGATPQLQLESDMEQCLQWLRLGGGAPLQTASTVDATTRPLVLAGAGSSRSLTPSKGAKRVDDGAPWRLAAAAIARFRLMATSWATAQEGAGGVAAAGASNLGPRGLVRCSASASDANGRSIAASRLSHVQLTPQAAAASPPLQVHLSSVEAAHPTAELAAVDASMTAWDNGTLSALSDTHLSDTLAGRVQLHSPVLGGARAAVGGAKGRSAAAAAVACGPSPVPAQQLFGHAAAITSVCVSAASRGVLSGAADGMVLCHSLVTGRTRWELDVAAAVRADVQGGDGVPNPAVSHLQVLNDGNAVAVVGASIALVTPRGELRHLWADRYPVVAVHPMPRPRSAACTVVVSTRRVSIVRASGQLRPLLDVERFCSSAISSSRLSADGTVLLCACENGTIACYTIADMI